MMMNRTFFMKSQKIAAVALIFALLVPGTVSAFFTPITLPTVNPLPPVPVGDSAANTKEVGITIMGITAPGLNLDFLAITILRRLIDRLTDDVVDWINGGGRPQFATDPQALFEDIADKVGGQLLYDIDPRLCSPFRGQIQSLLLARLNRIQDSMLGSRGNLISTQCTITQVINNVNQFLDGDFSQGGWEGWFSMTQSPQNNVFGAAEDAIQDLERRIGAELETEISRLDWAQGFLSIGKCLKNSPDGRCLQYDTTTPGSVINNQLEKVLNTELDQLNLADEFDEILSALFGRLMNTAFRAGSGSRIGPGIFDPSGGRYTNGGGGNPGLGTPLGFCSASKQDVIVGEDVEWTFTSNVQNPIISWGGDAPLAGSTTRVTVQYTTPGRKTGFVLLTTGTTTTRINCSPASGVNVARFGPISGTCFPSLFATYPPGQLITTTPADQSGFTRHLAWVVQATGGSGTYARYMWSGSKDGPVPGEIPPGGTTLPFLAFLTAGPMVYSSQRLGQKQMEVTVIDSDNTVAPARITCSNLVVF
jgi:hypothetical protein